MKQDPDPNVDVELERFCEWLSDEGHEPFSLSFDEMKHLWLAGRIEAMYRRQKAGVVNALAQAHRWQREWNDTASLETVCTCPTDCDCENPDPKAGAALVSEGCPVHNLILTPDPICPIHGN